MGQRFDAVDVIRPSATAVSCRSSRSTAIVPARGMWPTTDVGPRDGIYLRGMTKTEIRQWTVELGRKEDFSSLSQHTSKALDRRVAIRSLLLVPLVATFASLSRSCPVDWPHWQLDKLESIPGWKADLTNDQVLAQLREVGGVICAAGSGLAPADKKLYALRDVTGTVDSIPLIASSIMSKKIAEGTSSLVLDVKVGSGAFMRSIPDGRSSRRRWSSWHHRVTTRAADGHVRAAGLHGGQRWSEAVEVLAGGGPRRRRATVGLATEMLECAGVTGGRRRAS